MLGPGGRYDKINAERRSWETGMIAAEEKRGGQMAIERVGREVEDG